MNFQCGTKARAFRVENDTPDRPTPAVYVRPLRVMGVGSAGSAKVLGAGDVEQARTLISGVRGSMATLQAYCRRSIPNFFMRQ
jgi:hypothetical protein